MFKHRWSELTAVEKLEAASDLVGDLPEEELAEKAERRWGLNPLEAKEYASIGLPVSTYAAFSLKAMERLIPRLEEGSDPTTAITAEFPEFYQVEVRETLPPVQKDIRNPAVVRALTELRKVVNGLIRRYGEPQEIHIELARDLKAGKEERERRFQEMRRREAERQVAAERVCRERGGQASRQDIQKWLLAEECRWRCPYTQRGFSAAQLLDSGEIQVDHIIPFSRSLDDSFANKTLSYASANAAKGNRSPREAFEGTPGWESILEEVRHFEGPYKRAKLRRFLARSEEIEGMLSDFTSRQLEDTRYASRLAAKYVACLFGGLWDDTGRRVHVSHGQATAYLRRLWALDGLLSDEGRKTREDHRHHAVDAVVIALTGPRHIQVLTEAAVRASREGRRRFASIEAPWPGFVEEMRRRLRSVVVSYRVDRRVGKQMHEETHYGRIQHPEHGLVTVCRKPVHLLSPKEVSAIVDRRVRERVELQLGIHEGKAKALESDPPTLETRDGRRIPIRTVRIMTAEAPRTVGSGLRARNVVGGDFHHFEILRRGAKTGELKYEMRAVSEQKAMERVQAKQPVVNRESPDGADYVCSIGKADTLEVATEEGTRLVVVQSLEATTNRIGFKSLNDARPYSQANRNRERKVIGPLFSEMRCRKVTVTPLGEIRPAND